ncbi:hypothetical protein KBY24_10330 [Ruegeria pomeroyi]|uniref:Uncharacterized protein n=2 Tax=Ruegeria TaxID=97050 RepID=A0A9Q3WCQ9_9RHOB|nr:MULTISPECIES: cbb3-type cytochrome c oxidase subunit I [Ruegeria]MCE8512521.1 hypothetical protein [Ruegeria pomeroyi]MCE8517366.1 hypothetical protein [Ruegeria pomeroyi]MCE8521650.1 hypothetical protein [Ruegeria pomeroyi]MCE8525302.1 hypothetical protein [Ruegeria pomeroyi]MCE8529334.1 hypothetical protein [Ruegeria pomeroyi]
MNGVARAFLLVAILAGLCGMVWGIQMSASHDHTLSPAHGHLNLLGWVSCSIFAFYYHLVPDAAENPLARVHFGLVVAAVILLAPGVALAIQGKTELLAKLGSVIMLVSMLLFGWIVLKAPRRVAARA